MIVSGFSVQVTYDDIVCLVQSSLCIHYAGVGFPQNSLNVVGGINILEVFITANPEVTMIRIFKNQTQHQLHSEA